jgi:hypothetical protein
MSQWQYSHTGAGMINGWGLEEIETERRIQLPPIDAQCGIQLTVQLNGDDLFIRGPFALLH